MARAFWLLLACCGVAPSLVLADEAAKHVGLMYWTDRTAGVYRAARDGRDLELIVPRAFIDSIAVDRAGRKLYWTAITNRGLQLVELWQGGVDGGEQKRLADDLNWVGDVVFDPVDRRIYVSVIGDAKIICLSPDGTQRKDFLVDIPRPSRLYLDEKKRQLYWASNNLPRIDRINLDGSDRETVLDDLPGVAFGFVLDPLERKIYWTSPGGTIYRSKLDGGDREVLANELDQPDGLAVDAERRKLYWVERGRLSRSELDGTQRETLVAGKSDLYGSLELVPSAE